MPRRNLYEYSDFANKLYQNAVGCSEKYTNFVVSPFAIQASLALAYIGAEGNTAREMRDGLHISYQPKVEIGQHFLNVLRECQSNAIVLEYKIYVANRCVIKKEFKELAQKFMLSEAENIDFSNELTLKVINYWGETKTHSKMLEYLTSVPSDCKMLLLSAVYINGTWQTPFNPSKTRWTEFYINDTDIKRFKMMHATLNVSIADVKNLSASAIKIPFKESELSFLIILPKTRTGLKDMEEIMLGEDVLETMKSMNTAWVKVKIPKFKYDTLFELDQTLKRMDLGAMYSSKAQFGALATNGHELHVTSVMHRTLLDINEEGLVEGLPAENDPPKAGVVTEEEFICDRPFWFAVMLGNMMLVSGRYTGVDATQKN